MESGAVLTEMHLITQAAAGNASAFGELYTRYLNVIYRYIYYRVGDTRDAEDLTEMVFLKAWQAIPEYRDMGLKFSCWLYRIAHNVVVDFRRKQQLDPCIELESTDDEIDFSGAFIKQDLDVEESSMLAQAITRLNDDQQQIILLRFIEGLSHAEIARVMHKTEGACRMLQNRALVALNHQLQKA